MSTIAMRPQAATAEIQSYCEMLKPKAEAKAERTFGVYVAKTFITKVWEGTTYLVKVHVGGEEYVHLNVFKNPFTSPQKLGLLSIQTGKKLNDPLQF
ncbi:cystatin-B-like isoform X1 [Colossoma macropomum]|uniref:cystatin-B-like isoform X1 n=1 Tax=Colossoma macropomum TaxID=42526 RepID=UPI0018640142|nr:cystatin-B-like isoform X1 [Colossoma macropomum]